MVGHNWKGEKKWASKWKEIRFVGKNHLKGLHDRASGSIDRCAHWCRAVTIKMHWDRQRKEEIMIRNTYIIIYYNIMPESMTMWLSIYFPFFFLSTFHRTQSLFYSSFNIWFFSVFFLICSVLTAVHQYCWKKNPKMVVCEAFRKFRRYLIYRMQRHRWVSTLH